MSVSLENGEQLRAPILVGADGVRSRVAAHLGLKQPNYSGYIAYRSDAWCCCCHEGLCNCRLCGHARLVTSIRSSSVGLGSTGHSG